MAAPIAYEKPTLQRAWDAFVAHIPTLLVIWLAASILAVLGYGAQLLLTLLGNGVSGETLGSAIDGSTSISSWGFWLGQLGQFPFSILANLVTILFAAVPAMYFATGEKITIERAFRTLWERPWRYLLAGLLFTVVSVIGFLFCILPGIAVALVTPVYVNKIFTTEMSILDAFSSSFQAVYRSENCWNFVGIQVMAGLAVIVVSLCTCGPGFLLAAPIASFYVQNAAYREGVLT